MVPLICCWEYFPERKGLITGIIVGAYGFGSFVFNQISSALVNPESLKPTILIHNGKSEIKYYTPDVANNVP